MNNINKIVKNSKNFEAFSKKYFEHLKNIFENININEINQFYKEIDKVRTNGGTLYVIGNGGSAANAATYANDLGTNLIKSKKKIKPLKVVSLTENSSVITAVGNDEGYENIFVNQLKIFFDFKKDKLLVLSCSGNSKNLIKAVLWVKKKKGKIIAMLGFDGGKLKKLCNNIMHIKTEKGDYGPVEDIQLIFNHILSHWYQK
jgi:D-sedoheptulose 7-phosphate isomerase